MSAPIYDGGNYTNLSETGTVCSKACALIGFYVNSTSGGTLVLKDGGSGGTAITGTVTPVIGFHRLPVVTGGALHATIAVAALDVTFFYKPRMV